MSEAAMPEPNHCLKCGHEWTQRNPKKKPVKCPGCQNPRWDRPRKRRLRAVPQSVKEVTADHTQFNPYVAELNLSLNNPYNVQPDIAKPSYATEVEPYGPQTFLATLDERWKRGMEAVNKAWEEAHLVPHVPTPPPDRLAESKAKALSLLGGLI